ncbi:hypothetical protein S7711_05591 [Stachybotrys chartarum IBT 7711]|uniref:Rhamnogalacturonase A/B/Epimerase-like pectate lyase domain-containing protein n=1 Tax=Stachybotrys chartarum (strain CBS 109288 / IBT 7711) TaxID=1280523 RepID=A0A084AKD3_STACB|nr:hypothetical protein S7711_05591 [Stachybotrys chartarum IBT 7711]
MRFSSIFCFAIGGKAATAFWMEDIAHRGRSPYHPDPSYLTFRNVKDFGAIGDGVQDDTDAINAAISYGERCNPGVCKGNTISPATVYFPSGTYLISDSIIDLFYTQLIGDPTNRPVIKASPSFSQESFGLIDSNPYQPSGGLSWNSTNAFFRQIRNLEFDTTSLHSSLPAVGVHWPSSQATAITNCVFRLSAIPGNRHTGLLIEEGSGGLLNDLYFYGGGKAAVFGNQQYTARNLWFFNSEIAIHITWNWGWTYKSIFFTDCKIGILMDQESDSTGSVTLLDSVFRNVDTGIITTRMHAGVGGSNGTLILENVLFEGVEEAVIGPTGLILDQTNLQDAGNDLFIMGHLADEWGLFAQTGYYNDSTPRRSSLLQGRAAGDGFTDDTQALRRLFNDAAANGSIAYLDAGIYIVADTILIPPNIRIVGEALASVIMASGINFEDMQNPRPVIQVGLPGDTGFIEWSDTFVSARGPCAGAILIEYNLFNAGLPSGMWDVHTRIGGFAGTNLQLDECPAITGDDTIDPYCIAAYMSMRITSSAGGLFAENCWFWVADHDLEDQQYSRITVFAGRGLLIESRRGRIWLSATGSEHHVLYQYQMADTQDIYIGFAQTESPYYQPHPLARYPFPPVPSLRDPDFASDCQNDADPDFCERAWGMRILNSSNIVVYGAGLYSFFDTYSDNCAARASEQDCQARILSVDDRSNGVKFLGYSTVGTATMVHEKGIDLIPSKPNNSTFADTLALYRPSQQ